MLTKCPCRPSAGGGVLLLANITPSVILFLILIGFADKETKRLYITGRSRNLPAEVVKIALCKLDFLHRAMTLQDLRSPPGNRLEALQGNFAGCYSIRINDQFRIVFRHNVCQ
jgi:toxin HigB-1